MKNVKGQIWLFGDNVDTDQILPGYAMAESADSLGRFAMIGSAIPDFAKRVKSGDIIVAGKNFGCGSSREQAPVALQQAGVGMIIAESFARIFRRNAINIGLPVMLANVREEVNNDDQASVDLTTGAISVAQKSLQGQPLSANVMATIEAGGLINRVRKELGVKCGGK